MCEHLFDEALEEFNPVQKSQELIGKCFKSIHAWSYTYTSLLDQKLRKEMEIAR
jgi:hypothetical protein